MNAVVAQRPERPSRKGDVVSSNLTCGSTVEDVVEFEDHCLGVAERNVVRGWFVTPVLVGAGPTGHP